MLSIANTFLPGMMSDDNIR